MKHDIEIAKFYIHFIGTIAVITLDEKDQLQHMYFGEG